MAEQVTAIIAAVVTPVIAYLKIRDERASTAERRNEEIALIRQEIVALKEGQQEIKILRETLEEIRRTLVKIDTVLTMHMKYTEPEETDGGG